MAQDSGYLGNYISLAAALGNASQPVVSVAGNAISITWASKARMIVSGAGTSAANGTYLFDGGLSIWSNGTCKFALVSSHWAIVNISSGAVYYTATNPAIGTTPEAYSYVVTTGGSPAPAVSAGVSHESDIAAAVMANPDALALVVAIPSDPPGTSDATAFAQTFLSGGSGMSKPAAI